MSNEEKFKNKVKDLLNEEHFDYDPANWEVASKKLDKDDRRRRAFYLFFWGALIITLGYLGYPFTVNQSPTVHKTDVSKAPAPTDTKTTAQAIENTAPTNESTASSNPKKETGVKENKISEKNLPADKKSDVHFPSIKSTVPQEKIKETKIEPIAIGLNIPLANEKPITNAVNAKIPEIPAEEKKEEIAVESSEQAPVTINSPVTKPSVVSFSAKEVPENISPKADEKTKESTEVTATAGIQVPDSVSVTSRKDSLTPSAITAVPENSLEAATSPTTALPPSASSYKYLYFEAGTFYNFGWKYQGNKEGEGFNLYAGVSYETWLNERFSVSIGGYYSSLRNLRYDTREVRSSNFMFGEEYDVIAITPVSVNYLLVPLRVNYVLDNSQSLTLGYTPAYMLDVQSSVESYTERLQRQDNKTSYSTGGYVTGFKTFNHQISLGYKRSLFGNLWLSGELMYGLTDIRDNVFFGIEAKERLTGIKLSLGYNLIRK